MDTGDARGDLYFYLGQFLLPLECKNVSKQSRAHFDCDNPERVDPNLVVTRVEMELDPTAFTTYSACNLCNGTDPFSRKPCINGTYICDCESHHHSGSCDATKVGKENITAHFAPSVPSTKCNATLYTECGQTRQDEHQCFDCVKKSYLKLRFAGCQDQDLEAFCPSPWRQCGHPDAPAWTCWEENIPRKTGGFWYSTLKEGQCEPGQQAGAGCGWKVQSLKTIKESCLKSHLIHTVEAADKDGCFQGCGGPRNTTDACWIGCFFDTILGHEARTSSSQSLGGMEVEAIEKGWTGAFLSEEEGGCATTSIQVSI